MFGIDACGEVSEIGSFALGFELFADGSNAIIYICATNETDTGVTTVRLPFSCRRIETSILQVRVRIRWRILFLPEFKSPPCLLGPLLQGRIFASLFDFRPKGW